MKTTFLTLGILLFFLFCGQRTIAQTEIDSTKLYQVETIDGNKYIGKILDKNAETITLDTKQLGTITLQMSNIERLELIDSERLVEGRYWAKNLLSRRYFFGPNAFTLEKGEGYYQNTWILFNQVSLGVSKNVTIGVGLVPLFLFGGTATPVWITPKVAFKAADKFHLGAGGLFGTVIGESEGGFGIAYGIGTIGTSDINATLGLGYGVAGGEWADRPTISVSAMARVNRNTYLMTENYFLSSETETVSISFIGGRTVWERISLDYGLVIPLSEIGDSFIAIPWLSLVIPFRPKSRVN